MTSSLHTSLFYENPVTHFLCMLKALTWSRSSLLMSLDQTSSFLMASFSMALMSYSSNSEWVYRTSSSEGVTTRRAFDSEQLAPTMTFLAGYGCKASLISSFSSLRLPFICISITEGLRLWKMRLSFYLLLNLSTMSVCSLGILSQHSKKCLRAENLTFRGQPKAAGQKKLAIRPYSLSLEASPKL